LAKPVSFRAISSVNAALVLPYERRPVACGYVGGGDGVCNFLRCVDTATQLWQRRSTGSN